MGLATHDLDAYLAHRCSGAEMTAQRLRRRQRASIPHAAREQRCRSRHPKIGGRSMRAVDQKYGRTSFFVGDVVTKWLRHEGDDRLMQLRENFTFVESPDFMWTAPAGFIFDGATIPRALWTVFGDPFIGDYRRAAVIHDLVCTPYCSNCQALMHDMGRKASPRYICGRHPLTRPRYRVSSAQAAQTMYAAMRTDGVTERRARVIERAVARWGPQFAAESLPSMRRRLAAEERIAA